MNTLGDLSVPVHLIVSLPNPDLTTDQRTFIGLAGAGLFHNLPGQNIYGYCLSAPKVHALIKSSQIDRNATLKLWKTHEKQP